MEAPLITAFAALSGSAIGGAVSFLSSRLAQHTQFRAQLFLQNKSQRERLYGEFIEHASDFYIDALMRNVPDPAKAIRLYALIGRMRVLSAPLIIERAEEVGRLILDAYTEPNKTFGELRSMITEAGWDPLRPFSDACRTELETPTRSPTASAPIPLISSWLTNVGVA